jgi:peptide/nickel transport system substrate-binding protein
MTRRRTPLVGLFRAVLAAAVLAAPGCGKKDAVALRVAVIGTGPLVLGEAEAVPSSEAQAMLRMNTAQGLVSFNSSGQVEPGLAERWNVSDDGLSYVFRLASGEWPDGRNIMARDVARILKRQLRAANGSATRDALGAVLDVEAMTDRVLEITLAAPRPNLLELLAQPEWALIREGVGTGPFKVRAPETAQERPAGDSVRLTRRLPDVDGERGERENFILTALPAPQAIAAFKAGKLDLVSGGTIADLPLATRAQLPRNTLRFDPAQGLFGLQPVRAGGAVATREARLLLSEAIDREALIAALGVPGLAPRVTLLQAGLDGVPEPAQPPWLGQPLPERRAALQRRAGQLFAGAGRPRLRLFLPEGPGGDLLFGRLSADWGAIGVGVERAKSRAAADLAWLDVVAPSQSPAWYLRHFRCAVAAVCLAQADPLLDTARTVLDPVQRGALLADASRMMDDAVLFIAIAAPVRWSLVGDRAAGYQDNRFARHPLAGIMRRPQRGM